jgi:hypothetical protein
MPQNGKWDLTWRLKGYKPTKRRKKSRMEDVESRG